MRACSSATNSAVCTNEPASPVHAPPPEAGNGLGLRPSRGIPLKFDYILRETAINLRRNITLTLAAVVTVLLLGLWNMMRGGSPNLSQTLMRWRVILQFSAIVIMMAALYFAQH